MTAVRKLGFLAAFVLFLSALGAAIGCRSGPGDDEAIRAAVRQRLASLGTLNLQAMELDFTRITIQNNQATAEVNFRTKGDPAGAGMRVAYQLEKQDGTWRVLKTSTSGGMLAHPTTSGGPQAGSTPGDVHGQLPDRQDVLGGGSSSGASSAPSTPAPKTPAKP